MANHCEDKQPLLQVAMWSIGEYGDLFMNGSTVDGKLMTYGQFVLRNSILFKGLEPPSDIELIGLYQKFLSSVHVSTTSKQYALVSLAKLSTRMTNRTE